MTRFSILIILWCLLALTGCGNGKNTEQPRLAMVNTEAVFKSSQLAQQGVAFVNELRNRMTERMTQAQGEIIKNAGNQELEDKLQSEMMQAEQEFERLQLETATRINELFSQITEEYRQQHNLEMILPVQVIIASRPGADITSEIVALMDQKKLDFTLPPKEETK